MLERKEIKSKAKEQIKGNIGAFFLCYLVFALICGTAIGGLFAPAMTIGFCLMYLALPGGTKPTLGAMFKKADLFLRALWLMIITSFFITLWSMLLIVPGVIKALSYSMAPYILAEHPDFTASKALNESKRIMNGHKKELFFLALSFIPWFLLCSITFGIAFIYVLPYYNAAVTNFYIAIKE